MNLINNIIKTKNRANRGMNAEELVNQTNEYYLIHDKAIIHKKPTPIQVVKVDYPARNKAKIVEAYYKTPSTTDYNGIYKGYYLDFEVKETHNKKYFPLNLLKAHQINHLNSIYKHKGIAFMLIYFSYYNEFYLIEINKLKYFLSSDYKIRSIDYNFFKEKAYLIPSSYFISVDYLTVVDKIISNLEI